MNLEQILHSVGLNKKQASVYLASLKLGSDTAYNIAKQSGLKRTTVYFILEQLKEMAFVSIRKTQKATFYKAISPKVLLKRLQNQTVNLADALPDLEKLYQTQPQKPQIEVFEGKQGVRQVYLESERSLAKGEEVLYWGSLAHFMQEEYKDTLVWWIKLMKNKRFKAREILVAKEAESSDYLDKIKANQNPNHQIALAPRGVKFEHNDNMIFGNKLAIFSLRKEVFVVVIESEDVANSYRNFFELAWKQTMKVKK
ncbi:MAG: helix-turn-helix domain-containing protein [Patescibacteria group bacterium]